VLDPALKALSLFASSALPRIVFVLGKGGVGRSTVSAALGLMCAQRDERTLIMQWAVADAIGPWFAAAPAGPAPIEIAPQLSVANFALDDALRAYFVDHLHLGLVYRRVVRARAVARMIEVAPGLAEMFFLGQLWWLITLAEREAGLRFDRVIVDAPATGHAASLLDIPSLASAMATAGLLSVETRRVVEMLADPRRTGALVVSLPEPLVVDETLELIPRVTSRLGRPPLALVVNRSADTIVGHEAQPPWLDLLAAQLSGPSRGVMAELHDELRGRVVMEADLRCRVACSTVSFAELPGRPPIEVVRAASRVLEAA
jgi:anion-transporting  ArsA/GET3 family ATPase